MANAATSAPITAAASERIAPRRLFAF
ncbi:MAG: hypothetical protein QOC84_1153, partial [Bradyrhizobium sp.]|nr:hypothetical protein [Bradyrhizobium sp.]